MNLPRKAALDKSQTKKALTYDLRMRRDSHILKIIVATKFKMLKPRQKTKVKEVLDENWLAGKHKLY
ncbi:hypothetical protein ACTXT7_005031 [Hymenolepis weldensis]